MARDHARIRLDIWGDDDWRDLTSSAQWLYLHLLSSPSLTFCGVVDWRPARIAGRTSDLTRHDVEHFAAELEAGLFLIIDRDTEEALIRSWVKHDGLMKSPNMAKALVKAHDKTGSDILRAVVVNQLKALKKSDPQLKGWEHIGNLLRKRSMTPEEAFDHLTPNPSENPSVNPSGKGSGNPSANPSGNPSPTPFLPSSLTPSSNSKTYVSTSPGSRTDLDLEEDAC